MARRAIRKTDWGTIILHWSLVALLVIAVTTGLRIAIDSPYDLKWLHKFDAVLPATRVWTLHIPAGVILFALSISYLVYIWKARLYRRIRPDFARLSGITGRMKAKIGAINIILYWVFFITIFVELVTGILLYLGYAGIIADIHLVGTAVIIAYIPSHILIHLAMGGKSQLLRIFNPGKLAPAPPPFDPFELIAAAAMQKQQMDAQIHEKRPRANMPQNPQRPRRRRAQASRQPEEFTQRKSQVLHAHPLVVAIAAGLLAVTFLLSLDQATQETLVVERLSTSLQPPTIDGDIADPVWRETKPVKVRTQQGANFDGKGGTIVEIRAVHDGTNIYFSFVWDDPTRSLKHLPLAKTKSGWLLMHDNFDKEDANAFFEDKMAVLLAPAYVLIPGDRTFHAGGKPLDDKPVSWSGRGFHYTTDGSYVDVWQWRAANGGMLGWIEDSHFGPPTEPTEEQRTGVHPYKAGFSPDPGNTPFTLNFIQTGPASYDSPIRPYRLPRDLAATQEKMAPIDLHPNRGEREGSQWWMTEAESVPYSSALDEAIPVGTIIPGVIASGDYTGDRADIRGAAKWAAGHWSLELVRALDTTSKYDVPIQTGTYLRVAIFDHSQTRHTRHIRPIQIMVK